MYLFDSFINGENNRVNRTVAFVDANALVGNYKTLCSLTPEARHICVVKAGAYGHTCDICVPALLSAGCDFFAVFCIEEALAVRKICNDCGKNADILVLGYTDPRRASVLCDNKIIQTLISEEYAKLLDKHAKESGCRVRTHVAVDTGMNRIGICARNNDECIVAAEQISNIKSLEGLRLEGMYTHFAKADDAYDSEVMSTESFTLHQGEMFLSVRSELLSRGIDLFCHACNSAASVRFPHLKLDGVRLGILLYGVQPSEHLNVDVTPVMSLKSLICHIHTVREGQAVSYGGTYRADGDRVIATVPVGYADGFLRAYSGYKITVHTKTGDYKAPVVGRVCMDQCMIDVTGIPASVGDEVTVFGSHPSELSTLAKMAATIEYESLCHISARVPRIKK